MWAWPLTALIIGVWLATLRGTSLGKELRHTHPLLYEIAEGLIFALFWLGIRRGFKLVTLEPDSSASEQGIPVVHSP